MQILDASGSLKMAANVFGLGEVAEQKS